MIIDRQFLAFADGATAHIKDVALPDDGLDVGVAAVIDKLRAAAADGAVERPVIVQGEKVNHSPLLFTAAPGLSAADPFAGVLHNFVARGDVLGGIDAPSVNLRGSDF